jgi:hypothetical protein
MREPAVVIRPAAAFTLGGVPGSTEFPQNDKCLNQSRVADTMTA